MRYFNNKILCDIKFKYINIKPMLCPNLPIYTILYCILYSNIYSQKYKKKNIH